MKYGQRKHQRRERGKFRCGRDGGVVIGTPSNPYILREHDAPERIRALARVADRALSAVMSDNAGHGEPALFRVTPEGHMTWLRSAEWPWPEPPAWPAEVA